MWLWAAVATLSLAVVLYVVWKRGWLFRLADHEELVSWMRGDGHVGPLICIGIQFLQVVIFAIPGEVTQTAAGYVFGAWWGFAYSIIGILLGSAFNLGFARAVGRPVLRRILGARRLARADRKLQSDKGMVTLFVLYLLPGAPKDLMSYGAGLTELSLPVFVAITVPARAPALLLSTLFGSEAYNRDYVSMFWIALGALLLVSSGAYYQWRRRKR